ncbi:hypothetical protein BU26DRAFT_519347 [Trematosphaeria pertusa]|uniref:Uncharacterized protein n=1 Tax=Trematosphaeria pertusa TaxID=390896 RepID=A0A6A6IFL0_9PLEO|nr:uncharacterized protein BU26DRAFT_519347 [Trematosphaeria pertusa]KAF2249196.1 hypothetical protein BU26DRAFT_519347 [Trematosphaeria pertusa]
MRAMHSLSQAIAVLLRAGFERNATASLDKLRAVRGRVQRTLDLQACLAAYHALRGLQVDKRVALVMRWDAGAERHMTAVGDAVGLLCEGQAEGRGEEVEEVEDEDEDEDEYEEYDYFDERRHEEEWIQEFEDEGDE